MDDTHIMKYSRPYRGFTLIELLVVISIIGLLSSVVFAAVTSARQKGVIAAGMKFDNHTHSAFFDDLVLSWDFDNTTSSPVVDLSGNKNSLNYFGTGVGPTTSNSPFQSGKSFYIDTEALGASAATAAIVDPSPAKGNFSVSLWVYPSSGTTDVDYIGNTGITITNNTWMIGNSDNRIRFGYRSASGFRQASIGELPANQWYHIVGVCNGNMLGLYLNGKLVAQSPSFTPSCSFITNSINNTANSIQIGANGFTSFFVDNVRIYKSALSISAIDSLYFSELTGGHKKFSLSIQ